MGWDAVDQQHLVPIREAKSFLLGVADLSVLQAIGGIRSSGREYKGSLYFTLWLNEVFGKTQVQIMHIASPL